jgi:hypothetical protein
MSQLSLFSAEARAPSLGDLEGLLAGPGQVAQRRGEARVGVVVADEWRVAALVAELSRLGIEAEIEPAEQGSAVRTPFLAALLPMARAWAAGAVKRPPAGFALDGARLRWWCIAAGHVAGGPGAGGGVPPSGMYTLVLGPNDELAWPAVGAALASAGVPGALVGPRAAGPAYRIVGSRRLARLRELVGDPPDGTPPDGWPQPG